jgi:hypothetical protein
MKQSPVQYMFVELKRAFPKEIGKMYNDNPELLESVFQKAREKEKEVIMDAYTAGESDATHKINSALNYYNETFNTKEK